MDGVRPFGLSFDFGFLYVLGHAVRRHVVLVLLVIIVLHGCLPLLVQYQLYYFPFKVLLVGLHPPWLLLTYVDVVRRFLFVFLIFCIDRVKHVLVQLPIKY